MALPRRRQQRAAGSMALPGRQQPLALPYARGGSVGSGNLAGLRKFAKESKDYRDWTDRTNESIRELGKTPNYDLTQATFEHPVLGAPYGEDSLDFSRGSQGIKDYLWEGMKTRAGAIQEHGYPRHTKAGSQLSDPLKYSRERPPISDAYIGGVTEKSPGGRLWNQLTPEVMDAFDSSPNQKKAWERLMELQQKGIDFGAATANEDIARYIYEQPDAPISPQEDWLTEDRSRI